MNRSPVNKWGILFSVLLGSFTVILNNSMLNIAVPSFMSAFGIGVTTAQWVVIGYMLTVVISMTLNGYASERFGQRKVYFTGIILFLLGSVLGACSWSFASVVAFRALQGIGGGLIMPMGLTILYQVFPVNERGFAAGIWGVSVMMAPAIGPMIGGILMEYSSWHTLFLVNIPSGLLCVVMLAKFLKGRDTGRPHVFDKIGFVSVSTGLICLLLGLSFLNSPMGIGAWLLIGVGFGALVWFVRHELSVEHPLINMRIFRNRVFTICSMIAAVSSGSLFAGVLLIPLLVEHVLHYSSLVSGWILFPQALCMGIAATVGGKILDKRGARVILPLGLLLTATMSGAFGLFSGMAGLVLLSIVLVLRGIGMGLMNTPATTAGMNALDPQEVPRAVSANNVIRQMSGAVFSVFFSLFYEWRRGVYLPALPEEQAGLMAIEQSFLLLGIMVSLAIPAALWVSRTEARRSAVYTEIG